MTFAYEHLIRVIPDHPTPGVLFQDITPVLANPRGFEAMIDDIADHFASDIRGALVLEVPKEELYQRLALRGRDDDQSRAAIDQRFDIFEQNICSILNLLEDHGIPVRHVDGTGTPEEVTARLIPIIQDLDPSAQLQSTPETPSPSTLETPTSNNNFTQKEN